ncbi:hypothetical protein [Methanobrevibacter sp. V14]|uniref:hypothetical protein n=1 Tax=Methanobrevibacter sp. V14 TaxID=3064280 RepID=UPI00273530BD|nr:hypothetical protein [Methanobrevibacter sp. V14]
MAFTEVNKAPTQSEINQLKRQYRNLEKEYDELKYQYLDAIGAEDFEVLTPEDFLKLKEVYILKKNLYWKIHNMENPDDHATEKAYRFLNSMHHNDQFDFLMKHGLTTHELIRMIEKNPDYLEEVTA